MRQVEGLGVLTDLHIDRCPRIDDDPVHQAVCIAAAAILEKQRDDVPNDHCTGRAVVWERHEFARRRIDLQVSDRRASNRQNYRDFDHTAWLDIIHIEGNQPKVRVTLLLVGLHRLALDVY